MRDLYLKALQDKDFQNYIETVYNKPFEQLQDKNLMSDLKRYIWG